MKLHLLFLSWLGLVCGILQDELQQSWAHQHYGQLVQVQRMTNESAAALTANNELVMLDLAATASSRPTWIHQLPVDGETNLFVRGNDIVVVLNRAARATVQVYDRAGFLVREASYGEKIIAANEVAVLLSGGDVHLLAASRVLARANIGRVTAAQMTTDRKRLLIFYPSEGETVVAAIDSAVTHVTLPLDYTSIVSVQGTLVQTTDSVMRVDLTHRTVTPVSTNQTAFLGQTIFLGQLVGSYSGSTLQIHTKASIEVPESIAFVNYVAQEKTIAIYAPNSLTVVDIDDEFSTREIPLALASPTRIYSYTTEIDGKHIVSSLVQSELALTYYIDNFAVWTVDTALSNVVGHAIVVKKQKTALSTDEVMREETANIFVAYFMRLTKNLVTGQRTNTTVDDTYFGFNRKLALLTRVGKVFAYNTELGELLWTHQVQLALDEQVVQITDYQNDFYILTTAKYLQLSCCGEVLAQVGAAASGFVETSAGLYLENGAEMTKVHDDTDASSYVVRHSRDKLSGYHVSGSVSAATWEFAVKDTEQIVAVSSRPALDTTASIGVVLGDRSVLYKYLRPIVAAAVASDSGVKLYILDPVTGAVLHTAAHEEVIDVSSVRLTVGEYWVVYTYYALEPTLEQKVVVVDLFESLTPNTKNHAAGAVSALDITEADLPEVSAKSFILYDRIVSVEQTVTKHGITTRNVLFGLQNGQILAVPKYVLSSRRVANRLLTDYEKQEFMNFPYDPVVPSKDWSIVSHGVGLGPLDGIVSYPTELESTSIVCSYGARHVFCSRTTPSGKFDVLSRDFDKHKLVLTIVALVVAVLFTRPMVQRKVLKDCWNEKR
ncbi:hypothetical protein BABINDRAFT_131600 [Babjeviella inositovora NRRL Y-12698]|uniref:ER membrane protein complex subunit 1 n=1 Tax=Babjeviella inositovora NRRL Y-12698 TaxID=984486 RepID=A0A1E3QRG0_9ASCO|nr:uncharacterized protein BABINDRAFT_131600 [Babjeviella inositovora NRRL Y-12698]ODQ80293.1 hypothetical protein BABINDRAFT_131600 [Babjeviella inositovora NRRL Y-12698]